MGVAQFVAGQELTALAVNQLPVVVSYLTTGTVSNATAETIIGTFTIPAGDPTFPGGYWWELFGSATSTASPTVVIRMRLTGLAGAVLLSPAATTVSTTPNTWAIDGAIGFSAIGSSGSFQSRANLTQVFTGSAALNPGIPTAGIAINTTVSNTLVVTAQWSVANASNVASTVSGALYRL